MFAILLPGAALTIAVLGALVLLAVGIALYLVSIRNSLLAQRNSIDKALFEVEILLKQRHDELPKLLGICKSYMPREQKSFQALAEARAAYARAQTTEEKAQADEIINKAVRALFTAAQKYPDLKANANFTQLRNRLDGLEEKVAVQRNRYNEGVSAFNARIGGLPDKLVAGFMNLQPRPLLPPACQEVHAGPS